MAYRVDVVEVAAAAAQVILLSAAQLHNQDQLAADMDSMVLILIVTVYRLTVEAAAAQALWDLAR
jgi:hypothetical protein